MPQMPRLVSLILMATLIVILALTLFHVVAPFLMPLFLAAVLAILCQPLYKRCLGWTKQRPAAAAWLTTLIVLGSMLVPVTLGTLSAAKQLYRLAQPTLADSDWKEAFKSLRNNPTVQDLIHRYNQWTGEEVKPDDLESEVDAKISEVAQTLAEKTLGIAGSTISLLGRTVAMFIAGLTFVVAFYYFLADGPALVESSISLIPVHQDYQRQLIAKFDQAVRAVVSATFAAAIGQGIAAGIGMYVAGYQHFFLATILATLTALVPLLGTWLVWGPYALWLGIHGHWIAAGCLAVYGTVFIGLLDNVIRTYVLNSNVKLHPLLAFVSVLGGLQTLGLWGVFIGPIVAACLHGLVKIFNTELVAFSHDRKLPDADSKAFDPDASTLILDATDLEKIEPRTAPRVRGPAVAARPESTVSAVPAPTTSSVPPATVSAPPAGEVIHVSTGPRAEPMPEKSR